MDRSQFSRVPLAALALFGCCSQLFAQASTQLVDLDPSLVAFDGAVSVGGLAQGRLWFSVRDTPELSSLRSLSGPGAVPEVIASGEQLQLKGMWLWDLLELPAGRTLLSFGGGSSPKRIVLTDGTAAGTEVLPGFFDGLLGRLGGRAFFASSDGGRLWVTDGTLGGTQVFEDQTVGSDPGRYLLSGSESTLTHLFVTLEREVSGAFELRSIALGAPGSQLIDSSPVDQSVSMLALGAEALLDWDRGPASGLGSELYATDGTPGSLRLVADIVSGPVGSSPRLLAAGSGRAYFGAGDSATGSELWFTDGATVQFAAELAPGALGGVVSGGGAMLGTGVVFLGRDGVSGAEPWFSDGTAAGTRRLVDGSPGPFGSSLTAGVEIGGLQYFSLDPAMGPPAAWVTDGTPQGTVPLDVEVSSYLPSFTEFSGRPWFGGREELEGELQQELWSSGGTAASTVLELDAGQAPNSASSRPEAFRAGVGRAWFKARIADAETIWSSDGSAAGTRLAVSSAAGSGVELTPVASLGQGLLYGRRDVALGEAEGGEPWFTNGVPGQEVFLGDLFPGPASSLTQATGGSFVLESTLQLGSRLYLPADAGTGTELWSTDGTPQGTLPVSSVVPALVGVRPGALQRIGDRLAFASVASPTGVRLWFTDGTAAGTSSVPVPAGAVMDPTLLRTHSIDDRFYAVVPTSPSSSDLWVSEGTPASTRALMSVNGLFPWGLDSIGSRLLLAELTAVTAIDPGGSVQVLLQVPSGPIFPVAKGPDQAPEEARLRYYRLPEGADGGLWVTDGTLSGTARVLTSPLPVYGALAGNDGRLVFRAEEPGSGSEIWISDGTATGTGLAIDSLPGPGGTQPLLEQGVRVGDQLLFAATAPGAGTELHALSISALGGYVSSRYGLGCGIAASPQLTLGGEPRLGELVSLDVEGAAALAPVLHFVGLQADLLPIGNCSVLLSQPTLLVTGQTNGAGSSSLPFQLSTNPLWVGRSVYLQAAIGAAGGPLVGAFELTSALELVFGS